MCTCDPRTSLDSSCSELDQCNCRPNYSGPRCQQCAPGYYSYPSCTRKSMTVISAVWSNGILSLNLSVSACDCSVEGSRSSSCDPVSGQCVCLSNIEGQRCDGCSPGSYGFPLCQRKRDNQIQSCLIIEYTFVLMFLLSFCTLVGTCNPAGSVHNDILPTVVSEFIDVFLFCFFVKYGYIENEVQT